MLPLFRDLMDKSYEVHFKGRHVMDFPWMSFTGSRHEETEVTMLQHVTHYSEADGIIWINDDEKQRFIFKPAVKQGKSDDIRMTTYRCEFQMKTHAILIYHITMTFCQDTIRGGRHTK